jgi:hypothetical protein
MKNSNEKIVVSDTYTSDITNFANKLSADLAVNISVDSGRKYDKVYVTSMKGNKCLYFVDRADGSIYGSKSWAMLNLRRNFGTLQTTSEWVWTSPVRPIPIPGTDSYDAHLAREANISKNYGPRGRPKKVLANS